MKAAEAQKETLVAYTEYVQVMIGRKLIPLTFEEWTTREEIAPRYDDSRRNDEKYPSIPFHP